MAKLAIINDNGEIVTISVMTNVTNDDGTVTRQSEKRRLEIVNTLSEKLKPAFKGDLDEFEQAFIVGYEGANYSNKKFKYYIYGMKNGSIKYTSCWITNFIEGMAIINGNRYVKEDGTILDIDLSMLDNGFISTHTIKSASPFENGHAVIEVVSPTGYISECEIDKGGKIVNVLNKDDLEV